LSSFRSVMAGVRHSVMLVIRASVAVDWRGILKEGVRFEMFLLY
jgi:hypothetical protein